MELLEIGLPVLAAGLLILASHIPLGYQVLQRGIVFIDLAIAQVAALGTILAAQLSWGTGLPWLQQGMAIVFALFGAGLVAWINQRFAQWREAFIGLLYVTAASVLVLMVAGQPRGGQLLTSTLSGDILWLWADHAGQRINTLRIQMKVRIAFRVHMFGAEEGRVMLFDRFDMLRQIQHTVSTIPDLPVSRTFLQRRQPARLQTRPTADRNVSFCQFRDQARSRFDIVRILIDMGSTENPGFGRQRFT